MKLNRWMLIAALLSTQTGNVLGEDLNNELRQLKEQIEQLNQKVKILERNKELESEAAETKAKTIPPVSAGAGGVVFSSADTNFVLKLRGYIQADSRFSTDDQIKGNDSFLLRRVRPVFEGTVFQNFEYKIMPDFGANTSSSGNNTANNGMLQDAYMNIHYWKEGQLMFGKFKAPVGLERLQSARNLLFIERSLPTQLVPNRDVGVQLWGNLFDHTIEYALAAVNGAGDAGSDDIEASDDGKDIAARLFVRPFKPMKFAPLENLGMGIAGTIGNHEGTLRNYGTAGQQTFFRWQTGGTNVVAHGEQVRIVPQVSYNWGPFGLFGEIAISSIEAQRSAKTTRSKKRFENTSWEISVSYVLTGEDTSFDGITPKYPFSVQNCGWGAWEIAARAGQLSLDDTIFGTAGWAMVGSAREANEWGVGLNWYLNRGVKFNLDYHRTQFEGGSNAKGSVTAHDEQVILARVQLAF